MVEILWIPCSPSTGNFSVKRTSILELSCENVSSGFANDGNGIIYNVISDNDGFKTVSNESHYNKN